MARKSEEPRISAQAVVATPFGAVKLTEADGVLVSIDFAQASEPQEIGSTPTLRTAHGQLARYFEDPRTLFSLPLSMAGTAFKRRVWAALAGIPPGSTETYGSLACRLGSGPRAIAGACRANPFPIVVPCHRVVAAGGLGGYAGQTSGSLLEIKRWLLRHEGCSID